MVEYELSETISSLIPRGPPPHLPPRNSLFNDFNPEPEKEQVYEDLPGVDSNSKHLKSPGRSTKCSDDYLFYEETGYCYKVTLDKARFESARAFCESENGHLVSVHSKKENYYLENLYNLKLEESKRYEKSGVWLGLVGHNGPHLKWIDGTKIDFTNWGRDNQRVPERNWVVMDGTSWVMIEDGWSHPFICKRPSKTMMRQNAEANLNCTDGYVYLNTTGYCYKVSIPEMTFREAEVSCKSENAHLASVHSIKEHYFLVGLYHVKLATDLLRTKSKVWLGLGRPKYNLEWTDGTSIDFGHFPKTERQRVPDFDFVVIDGEYWNMERGSQKHSFICKKLAERRKRRGAVA